MIHPNDQVAYYGQVPKEYCYVTPTRSTIAPSLIHDSLKKHEEFTPKKCPVILHRRKQPDGSYFYPMRQQIEKQFVPAIVFPKQDVEEAYINLRDKILSMSSPYTCEKILLTEHVNLNGIEANEHFPAMNHKKAPGYPWNFHIKNRGRADLLIGEPGSFTLRDDIRVYLNEIEKEFSEFKIRPFMWADCMKDDKLPI